MHTRPHAWFVQQSERDALHVYSYIKRPYWLLVLITLCYVVPRTLDRALRYRCEGH